MALIYKPYNLECRSGNTYFKLDFLTKIVYQYDITEYT